ncbi:MAG TPA: rhomboid family intramembrane serine protease [Bacillota bacterium]|nr:rhomboid family intramembrane serine protease [Bacillota bacterium]HPF42492.1 rhomboid family intramembrane serine protease [Bacillota bacterium]HPJ85851.1 rhomboid family intramembrane serine protease [Bacillota bacterium]HPQ62137.1 rhomboid family intramembrane serine protease [Bacillota bacterium]HRX91673.1 rhomboid family intramembrane serine protease [Candidatus Izemoplasmatales bacterium]
MADFTSRLKKYIQLCPMTSGLLTVNTAFLIITIITGGSEAFGSDNLVRLGGIVPSYVASGEYYRIIFAMFLHGGYLHFFSNMLALYFLGTPMERIMGGWRYLALYMLSGIGAGIMIVLFGYSNITFLNTYGEVSIGASTAIYGIMAGLVFITIKRPGWFPRQTVKSIWMIAVLNFIITFIFPYISVVGHLSGFVFGFVLSLVLMPKIPEYQRKAVIAKYFQKKATSENDNDDDDYHY